MKYQAVKINFEPKERERENVISRTDERGRRGKRTILEQSSRNRAETLRIVREKIYIERDKKESLSGLRC